MSKPFCHWPLAAAFCIEPNLISPYMPIFIPGTGDGATPNRSLLPGGGALRLRSAAGMNFAWESESANADASRDDTGVADCALLEAFEPFALVSPESANAMALRADP